MSSPNTAFNACSRLSPYIAFGIISIREIYQALLEAESKLDYLPKSWEVSYRSYKSRLLWHCHFIQKLEDEPTLENQNCHPAFDGLRENDFNEERFEAWKQGKTGYPLIDATMRALIATGWINFRMRAMLVSFASYHLWLDWRKTSIYLANLFVDYEPGIHYNQFQMQSGTTGINAVRVYNPIKQSQDQEPEGKFIKHWVPELKSCPVEFIHEPWSHPKGIAGYSAPIVEESIARKESVARVYGARKGPDFKEKAKKIVEKHASPRRKTQKVARRNKGADNSPQQNLFD